MRWMRPLAPVIASAALAACSSAPQPRSAVQSAPSSPAQTQGQIRSMLWVGNSFFYYNNSMHGHVG